MLNRLCKSTGRPTNDLSQRFNDWYAGLPEITRSRPFSMSEFEAALKTQGKPVLLGLGWATKKAFWSTNGQYHRYWRPLAYAD
jgi:hypothetical protein